MVPLSEQTVKVASKEFSGFIQAIMSVFRNGASLIIHKDYIDCLVLSEDNASIILYAKVGLIENSKETDTIINVRDLSKFIMLIDLVRSETFTFKIRGNAIYYMDSKVSGAKFILQDSPIRKINTTITVDWFNRFTPYFKTILSRQSIKEISRLASFANDSSKIYIFEENGAIVAELNDHEKVNIDTIKVKLTETYEGHIIDRVILEMDSLMSLSSVTDELIMEVAQIQNHEALFFTIRTSAILLKYLFASKIR